MTSPHSTGETTPDLDFGRAHVAALFNEMASEYDQLEDVWYPHIFNQIEKVIRTHFPHGTGKNALDVGCGTGFQTFILESLGYRTTGIDIAGDLVKSARDKAARSQSTQRFSIANAQDLPFPDRSFDLVSCCGSTLSFVENYARALSEMSRVLRLGGWAVLEVEQRWTLDLIWGLLDSFSRGALGYDQSLAESFGNISRKWGEGIVISYPFTRLDGSLEYLPIRCFTLRELSRACTSLKLSIFHTYGIHSITNLIPSTWLGDPQLRPALRRTAARLAKLEDKVKGTWPFDRLGCSMMLVLRKES